MSEIAIKSFLIFLLLSSGLKTYADALLAPLHPRPSIAQEQLVPVCSRTFHVQQALVLKVGKPCEQITSEDLSSILQLMIQNTSQFTSLKAGDFSGLVNLTELLLNQNAIGYVPSGVFNELSNLQVLALGGNQISFIQARAFVGCTSLTNLFLGMNRLTKIEPDSFLGLENLMILRLTGNQIDTILSGAFAGFSNLEELSLERHLLVRLDLGIFRGLTKLTNLEIGSPFLEEIAVGVFDDTPSLQNLDLVYVENNELLFSPLSRTRIEAFRNIRSPGFPVNFGVPNLENENWL